MPLSQSDPFLNLKLGVFGCVLALATATIGYDAVVYRGGPTEAQRLYLRRQAEDEARRQLALAPIEAERVASGYRFNRDTHAQSLNILRAALGPKAESRCAGHNRAELREALRQYVINRAAAQEQAAQDPSLPELGKIWDTPEDAEQLADARRLWREGYIAVDDLQPWTKAENAVFDITEPVVPVCNYPLAQAMNDDPYYHPSPRPRPSPPYQPPPRRRRAWN